MLTALAALSLCLAPQDPPPGIPADPIAAIRSNPTAPPPAENAHVVELVDLRGNAIAGASIVVVPAGAPTLERARCTQPWRWRP